MKLLLTLCLLTTGITYADEIVLALAKDPAAAKAKALKARAFVVDRQRQTMQIVSKSI